MFKQFFFSIVHTRTDCSCVALVGAIWRKAHTTVCGRLQGLALPQLLLHWLLLVQPGPSQALVGVGLFGADQLPSFERESLRLRRLQPFA